MSEDTWYGPDDVWPRHPKKHFRDALDHARAAGWHLRVITGHSFSTVYCCRNPDSCCYFVVFSTGRGGESAANTLTKMINACAHRSASATADWVADVDTRLDQVETMLTAAADCVAAESHRRAAYDLLALITTEIAGVEALLEAAQAAEEHAIEVITETWTVINAQVPGLPFPTASAEVIKHVEIHLTGAETDLSDPPSGKIPELPGLGARASQLRAQLTDLRAQLSCPPDDVI